MKFLKFLIAVIAIFALSVFAYGYLNEYEIFDSISNFYKRNPTTLVNNEYIKDVDNIFVKKTDNFTANSKQELLDIYYTIISSGMEEFTFYCDKEYINCIDDMLEVNNNASLLSQMNNFVNVFNTFKSVKTTYTNNGKITLSLSKRYTPTDIIGINLKINEIYDKVVDESKSEEQNIKKLHDYIINNTKYNVEEENPKEFTSSTTAIGVLHNNSATCNGYTDTMSIFLDKLGVPNVRISNATHIWNLVYVNDKWLHLDLTWDDPVNSLNQNLLTYDYYLKTNQELKNVDKSRNDLEDHTFDEEIYNFIA